MYKLQQNTEFAVNALRQNCFAQKTRRNFLFFPNLLTAAIFIVFSLSSCTMVSKEMLPGMEYRENPQVKIIEYDDHAKLQEDCAEHVKETYIWLSGCSLVPQDPQGTCIIRIMAGDERIKKHEMAHCHGHADTFLPWKADSDFYSRHKQQ
jgi:hypothetical protein